MKLGRGTKRILWVSAAFAILFVLAHSGPAKEGARRLLVSALAGLVDGDASLDRLDYRLWRGEMVLDGLTLAPNDGSYTLGAPRVRLEVTGFPRVSLEIVEPELALGPLPEGSGQGTGTTPLAVLAYVEDVRIERGVFGLSDALRFEGVDVDLLESSEGHRLALHAASGGARVSGEEVPLGPLDADAVLTPESVRIVSASLYKDASFLRAEGELTLGGPLRADLAFDTALEASLARLVSEGLELRGVVTATGRASLADGTPHVEADVRSEELGWRDVVARDLSVRAELEDSDFWMRDLTAETLGGRLVLEAALSLNADGDRVVDLSWEDVDPSELSLALAGESLPLSSRSAGALHLDLDDWTARAATGSAELRFVPVESTTLPSAEGTVTASLDSGVVTVSPSNFQFSNPTASIDAEGTVRLDGSLDLGISASVVPGSIASLPVQAGGVMEIAGELEGTARAPAWTARLSSRDLRIEDEAFEIAGTISGDFESATVDALALGGGGRLEVQGIAPLNASRVWSLDLSGSGVRLPEIGSLQVVVAEASGHVEGSARSPDATATVHLDPVSLHGGEGEARLTVHKVGETITLDDLRASLGSRSTMVASGSYDLGTDGIEARLDVVDLSLERLAPGLGGWASLDLDLAGSRSAPEGTATLRVSEIALHDHNLPDTVLTARGGGGQVSMEGSIAGTPFLRGSLMPEAPFPLHVEADLGVVPWDDLARASGLGILETWSFQATGSATLDAEIGELRALRYQASFEELAVTTENGTATSTPVLVEGDLEGVSIKGLALDGPPGRLSVNGTVPFAAAGEVDVTVDASLPLENFRRLSPDLEVQGEAVADLTLTGSWNDPRAVGRIDVEDSDGRWREIDWNDVSLSVHASDDRLDRIELRGTVLGGKITADGQAPLRSQAVAGRVELALDGVDFGPLLHGGEDEDLAVVVSLDGVVDRLGLSLSELSGSGELQDVVLRARGRSMNLGEPASWRLDGEHLELSPMTLRGEDSELSVSLRTLDIGDEPRIEASAAGAVDLSIVNALLGDIPELSTEGRAELEIDVAYSDEGLALSGSGALSGARVALNRPRFVLSDVSAGLELQGSRVIVSNLSASAGPGTLEGGGFIDLDPEALDADLRAEARRVPLELMDGLRIETSGSIRLASAEDTLRLSGDLSLDRGLLTREFDDEDMGFSSRQVVLRDPTESRGLADRLLLDVTITTRRNLIVENSLAQLELAGNVTLGGTLTTPQVGGIVTLLPDGYIQIGRNRFQVLQGRADLTGFPLTPPRLELVAVTRVGQTLVQIDLEGDADDLRTRLTAPESPDLTEGDLASLLVTGRTLEQAGEGGQEIASTWMMSSLANLVHEGMGDVITYGPPPGAGPVILAEEADPTSRLTFGVPVTHRLSATYSIALNDAEKRLWILDYRVAQNIWLRGIQENSNDYSIGVTQRFSLDLRGRARAQRLDGATRDSVERLAAVFLQGVPEGFEWKSDIRAGDRYDYWSAQDDARRLATRLIERGYASAVVDVRTEPDEAQRLRLVFEIVAGKPTSFVWNGDDPGKDLRRSIERAWDGRIPEAFLLPDLAQRARSDLAARRYYLARVDARVEDDDESRRVVFDVERGPRGDRVEIHFEGNEVLDEDTLRAVLPPANQPAFFLLLERHAELERGIRLRYASEGYLDTHVDGVSKEYDERTSTLLVTVAIEEGSVTRVTSVAFEGGAAIGTARLDDAIGVALGDPVDFPAIRRGEVRIRTLYREEGFPDVRLRSEVSRTVEGLEVDVAIEEGARARVGDIRVVGNIRTRESVIRNELTFGEGDPVRITDFQESQKRLYDLGILRTADVRTDPAQEGQSRQDVIVQVTERPDLDVNYGIRYNFLTTEQSLDPEAEPKGNGFEGVARVNVVNPIGFGSNAGFSIFYQSDYRLYRGTFRVPTPFGKRVITELVLDTEREQDRLDIPGLGLRRDSVTFQQTKKLRDLRYDKLALQWSVSYAHYRGQSVDFESGAIIGFETKRPRFGISFIDDRRDSFSNPTRGRFWNVTFQYTPEIWSSDVSYYRVYGQFFYYFPIPGRLVWASAVRAGFAPGERPFLLIDDRFQAGGANTVRGFKQNTLGPSVIVPKTGEEIFIGGQALGIFNQELRVPIYKSFHAGLFWDVGNVFAKASDFRFPDLRHSVGAGLRFVLSFGAVRLDWARVLDAREGESTSRLHFSFGYAF